VPRRKRACVRADGPHRHVATTRDAAFCYDPRAAILAYARAVKRTVLFLSFAVLSQCSSTPAQPPGGPQPLPGEQTCDPQAVQAYLLNFDPPYVVVAKNGTRPVELEVNPDVCAPTSISFTSDDPTIVTAPTTAQVDLRHATYDFTLQGASDGVTTIHATYLKPDGTPYTNRDGSIATSTLKVDVRDAVVPVCSGSAAKVTVSGAAPVGTGNGASVGSTAAAFSRTDWLALPQFDVSIGCGTEMAGSLPGYVALSPAISFTPDAPLSEATPLRREIDFSIPINPAIFPTAARMRHLEVLFSNVKAKTPRPITIASPRIDTTPDGNYVLRFSSPWFGTYQAAVRDDAGGRSFTRHLTHRAVIGISMGSGGAATFGYHHHDEFDSIGPLGGPSDWTWLGWFVEHYALGGFCPASDPSCTIPGPSEYPATDTYMHTMDFDHWWYEAGQGNGGHFSRSDYIQLLTDLSLQLGNSNGQNADQTKLSIFPAGVAATDPWVTGDTTGLPAGTNCAFTLSPLNQLPDGGSPDPFYPTEQQIESQCATSRCDPSHTLVIPSGYYDDEYNPNGTEQVISFCDGNQLGSANNDQASPYESTFAGPPGPGQGYAVNPAFAVDLNKNGVRDADEPVIRAGHEPYTDTGVDGLADVDEPGYDAATNPDPNGDDYDPYINPTGTENDHRYELGEPFLDYGLDGVQGTQSSPYDLGEGDGVFTLSKGLQTFYTIDPHSILRGWSSEATMTDDDVHRLTSWSDGGVRDLFNFAAVATHYEGALSSRRTSDGHFLQQVAYYNNFNMLPGEDPTQPDNFVASNLRWADIVSSPSLRYGTVDATTAQIQQGDGQHVGTGAQILYRLEAAFYFVSHQWPDADRLLTNPASDNPETTTNNVLGTSCEVLGHCEFAFTGTKSGRTGPIAITLPPGYGLEENRQRDVRYPVVFVLHGYGQKPEDLEALQLISNNFMNDGTRSYVQRLPKFIAVYVDGRCREGTAPDGSSVGTPQGQPECVQGGFYLDSTRPGGALFDTWFDELVQYIDQNYRTMGPADVNQPE